MIFNPGRANQMLAVRAFAGVWVINRGYDWALDLLYN